MDLTLCQKYIGIGSELRTCLYTDSIHWGGGAKSAILSMWFRPKAYTNHNIDLFPIQMCTWGMGTKKSLK